MDDLDYSKLNEAGFKIVENVLTQDEIDRLKKSLVENSLDICFRNQGISVDSDVNLEVLTNEKLRRDMFGNSKTIWRKGNTRQPLISKTCGMTHIHYNKEMLELITFNENLYNIAKDVMGRSELVHAYGPERFAIKAQGSEDMGKHIDANPFYNKVNVPHRIQSLVTLQMDTSPQNYNKCGTLCILSHFHHFWDFFGFYFHPLFGYDKYPDKTSRFFTIEKETQKNPKSFDTYFLPELKKSVVEYHFFLNGDDSYYPQEKASFFNEMKKANIKIPENTLSIVEKIKWTYLKLTPGSMVFWHQHLPHFSSKNTTVIPRICCYYNLFSVKSSWYTPLRNEHIYDVKEITHREWVVRQFQKCEFYYGVDYNYFPVKPQNVEELDDIKRKGTFKEIQDIIFKNDFRKKLVGYTSYFGKYGTIRKIFDSKYGKEIITKTSELKHVSPLEYKDGNYSIPPYRHLAKFLGYGDITDTHITTKWEYYSGGDLQEYIDKISLSENKAIDYFIQVLKALRFLHKNKIAHLDVKTKNIFIEGEHLVLGDFGFSAKEEEGRNIIKKYLGTPNYMAPEIIGLKIFKKNPEYRELDSYKLDSWALGVLFYKLLMGICPHKFYRSNMKETFNVKRTPINYDVKLISSFSKKILQKLLVVNPKDRIEIIDLYDEIKKDGIYKLWKKHNTSAIINIEKCVADLSINYKKSEDDIISYLL